MRSLVRQIMEPEIVFFWLAPAIFLAWLGSAYVMASIFPQPMDNRGIAGDQFGAINALFSGLAFAGLITTLLLQRKELELQRDELRMTRQEHSEAKEQLKAQANAIKKQNFESTFFEMIRLHHSIVSALKYRKLDGRSVFRGFYLDVKSEYEAFPPGHSNNGAFLHFGSRLRAHRNVFYHYFRNLFAIMQFIDQSNMDNKEFYISLVKAQFSTYEIVLIFYYGGCADGLTTKPLIQQYSLLDELIFDKIPATKQDLHRYIPEAYGNLWSSIAPSTEIICQKDTVF